MKTPKKMIRAPAPTELPDCPKCHKAYLLASWEVTSRTQAGLPIQTLYGKCLACGHRIAIRIFTPNQA